LFDYVKGHKYKLFQILYGKRFENYLGGLMGQECRHISGNMIVRPRD
jgi:hypothetical protein